MSRYDDPDEVWRSRARNTYLSFTMFTFSWILAAVVTVAAIVLLGWLVGWWFTDQNINRESHALRNSYANQQTLRDQITQNIGNVLSISTQITETSDPGTKAALKAQRVAVVNIVCGDAAQVTGDPLSADQASFIKTNCEAGNIKPGSPYTK